METYGNHCETPYFFLSKSQQRTWKDAVQDEFSSYLFFFYFISPHQRLRKAKLETMTLEKKRQIDSNAASWPYHGGASITVVTIPCW